MIAETRIHMDNRRLLKFEIGFLTCLVLITLFTTQALVHNYSDAKPAFVLHPAAHLIPATSVSAVEKSGPNLVLTNQSTHIFQPDTWVVDEQVFVSNSNLNDSVAWVLTGLTPGRKRLRLYLTKSNDYGIVQLFINGNQMGAGIDLFDRTVRSMPAVDMGMVEIEKNESSMTLRLQVVGKNSQASAPFYQFGVQGFALEPVVP